jgi:hypothetical protein
VADDWCWFVVREKYCWLVVGGWFVLREKYYWLVADKPSEKYGLIVTPYLAASIGVNGVWCGMRLRVPGRRSRSSLPPRRASWGHTAGRTATAPDGDVRGVYSLASLVFCVRCDTNATQD